MNKTVEHTHLGVGAKGVAAVLLSLALLLLSALPVQAEIYKWVDEKGQVNYTQTPPPDRKKHDIETISITPSPVAAPTVPDAPAAAQSCGSITLPARRLDPVANLLMYRQARAIWQKYIDENLSSSDAAIQKGVADRRCAIAAANSELQALSSVEQRLNSNYEQVRAELEALQQNIKACDEPDRADEELSAAACRQQYQERQTQLETMLHALEGPKKMLEQGE